MKYIKKFLEANFDRNVNVEIKKIPPKKIIFGGKPSIIYDNHFTISNIEFSGFFQLMKDKEIPYWEGAHGYIEDGEIVDKELKLSFVATLDLIKILTNIAISFLMEVNPNVLLFNHKDMENEYDLPYNKLNKRAEIFYKFLKDKIPTGYVLSYWYNNYYQDEESRASISCLIYKQNTDLSALVEDRIQIAI